MRTLRAVLAIVLLIAPLHAEAKGGKHRGSDDTSTAKKKPDDGAYNKALSSIPDQKPADPWAGKR